MNFRTLRKTKGLTQARLAQLAGVNQVSISQIELGKVRSPRYLTVSRLASVLGVTSDVVARAITETKAKGKAKAA